MKAEGKVIVITGANAGIGFATAFGLAKEGAQVCLVCRNAERGAAALKTIAAVALAPPMLFIADLASQASIRTLADTLHGQLSRVDVLINNAGAAFAERQLTTDGIERTFATNHLAPFLLTTLVMDLLGNSPQGRIVNLTAGIPVRRSTFLGNLQGEAHYSQFSAYRTSKVSNILFTYELARRLQGTAVTANCVHPGPVRTEFTQKAGGLLLRLSRILWLIMKSPEEGAQTPIYLATAPELARVTGAYFISCTRRKSPRMTYDCGIAARLWEISEQLTSMRRHTHRLNAATTA